MSFGTEIDQVADAVVDLITAESLAVSSVNRVYLPLEELENIPSTQSPFVLVFPTEDTFSLIARDTNSEEVSINIGVLQKLATTVDPSSPASNAAIDPLVRLCRTIANAFTPGYEPQTNVWWYETRYAPMFDAKLLRTHRVFCGVIIVKFKQADPANLST
jgi:hypothetical protein